MDIKMSPEIPARCTRCLAFSFDQPLSNCQVCHDQALFESYLCDIARSSSSAQSFICHAFRPNLTLVGRQEEKTAEKAVCQNKQTYFANVVRLMGSGQCAGGGCGNQGCQPESNGAAEKYHVVLSVRQRKPVFAASNMYVSFLHDVFLSCGHLMAGKVFLLWLAPDHLHLYLECAGWESENEIVEDLQGLVHDALMQEFPGLRKDYEKTLIWDRDFFLEKISSE